MEKHAKKMEELMDEFEPNKSDLVEKEKGVLIMDKEKISKPTRAPKEPERTIDLHGCTIEIGKERLQFFIETCHRARLKKILVIVGKGLHSEGKSILKEAILRELEELKWKGKVRSFGTAPSKNGGTGAIMVILN
ncbi:Smr/MutS family protein [Candidatus Peregrinibacteria bacterium]|nr:MAG: Smr/MutS family protein [Candidatus Peregrinibacteria bacterium]